MRGNGLVPAIASRHVLLETRPTCQSRARGLQTCREANPNYDNFAVAIDKGIVVDGFIVVEISLNSWLWMFDYYASLPDRGFHDVCFEHCKWSCDLASERKWTRLQTNCCDLDAPEVP